MNRTTYTAALLLLALLWAPAPSFAAHNPFIDCSITQLQERSAKEEKLYFLMFTADFVMTCQWMEEETFTDRALLAYLEQSYNGLRVDISQAEGAQLQQQYEVTQLPSVLVFSARGQLLGRLTGAIPAEELQSELQSYDLPANRQSIQSDVMVEETDILPSPQPILQLSMPRLVPDVPAVPASLSAAARPQSVQAVRQVYTDYFTVQIGVFGTRASAEKAIAQFVPHCTTNIQVVPGSSNGSTIYRLYAGKFPDRSSALTQHQDLTKRGIQGFVKQVRP